MNRFERADPFPSELHGQWADPEDASSRLVKDGGEVVCFGEAVEYDYKLVQRDAGALMVSLKTNDETNEDAFQRANVTELVLTREGDFHAYNIKFATQFVRIAN